MNRTLLDHLQQMRSYPSITILMNTRPGSTFGNSDLARARELLTTARGRLDTLIDEDPTPLLDSVEQHVDQRVGQRSTHALAICVSHEYQAAVLLGGTVEERVVIDVTFATRDLVADLHRTVVFQVLTVSDSVARRFAGDRQRLIEERSDQWPLQRDDDLSDTLWSQTVTAAARDSYTSHRVPTVTAGVDRSTKRVLDTADLDVIGHVSGNHDRTAAGGLHTLVWPIVLDWKRLGQTRALEELDDARSSKRYAAGVGEIWPLAEDGRVEHLLVEDDFRFAARIDDNGLLHPTDDDHRDVTDDVVDELIEAVLAHGGRTTIVDSTTLEQCGHVAAVLRY
ncbi:MAG: hypothetical protein ABJH68_13355 [Ilumatobacter sp.]|uniref:baeRF3 domain-containing protein n=1 Tax=Ilumatobacter sp. TaxID=1967498 RepID=UPI003298FB6E